MPKVKVNDINIYYEIRGEGYPLVLISGFGADHITWGKFADKLALKYKIILFDNRGSGQTDCPDQEYSMEQLAKDVKNLCDYLNIEKASFIGYSMGGFIVQQLAHDYSELCENIIILNSATKITKHYSLFMQAFYALLNNDTIAPEILAKLFLPWAYSDSFLSNELNVDKIIETIAKKPHPFTLIGFKNQRSAVDNFDSTGWIKTVRTPALIVGSKKDIIFYEKNIRNLFELMPNSKYFKFKNVGHLPYIEEPDKLLQVVHEFIG
ncbi:alpha/beta fold hydrolase [Francisella halioticida]|nr:alpha/beta hydrolase [Francisella halioticida]